MMRPPRWPILAAFDQRYTGRRTNSPMLAYLLPKQLLLLRLRRSHCQQERLNWLKWRACMLLTITRFAGWDNVVQCMAAAIRHGRNVVFCELVRMLLAGFAGWRAVGAAVVKSDEQGQPLIIGEVADRGVEFARAMAFCFLSANFRMSLSPCL